MNEDVDWFSPGYYQDRVGMNIRTVDSFDCPNGVLRFCWWTNNGARITKFVRSFIPSDWEDLAIELLRYPVKDKA